MARQAKGQGAPICQQHLPFRPWSDPVLSRLPGLKPVEPGDWLRRDEAFAPQMALRDALLATRRDEVLRLDPGAEAAARALLEAVLEEISGKDGYRRAGEAVTCPDGRRVTIDRADPLLTAGRLVQEDLVLMQRRPGESAHLMRGAVVCFPASWTLAEKFNRPLAAIHTPVAVYSDDMARRVQRLFDGLRLGRPIWRANAFLYEDPALFQPRREDAPRPAPSPGARWLRMERQVLRRLEAVEDTVVFSIHTWVLDATCLSPEDRAALGGGPEGAARA
ncbi:MAG: DUF3445 domain-containing protein [Alphaproteobacteria bacterium]|nr:MAG: DUF3445 domain-containing protein [Alphaproteobacteria bacterium]